MSKLSAGGTQKITFFKLAPRLIAARWLQLGIVDKLRATDKKKEKNEKGGKDACKHVSSTVIHKHAQMKS